MGSGRLVGWAVGSILLAFWAQAQTGVASAGSQALISTPAQASVVSGEIIREIDDPHTGYSWLLERDPSHPGGPGLLRLDSAARGGQMNARFGTQGGAQCVAPAPVIHIGDRVIVEEHTRIVDSRLEAVALNPAAIGFPFKVRLAIGGRTMRAVALAPGRAVLAEETRR